MSPERFQQLLLDWFDRHGRKDLPWQKSVTPYSVWVSEIMLQQTQVNSVIPYYNKFMLRFPDVQALADAELDEVLQYWSGLGYYARARNLHKAAQQLAAKGGEFPDSVAEMISLPGIGRSTAGAILSIACSQSQPILDGNVKRVLSRFQAIRGWVGDKTVTDKLWQISQNYTAGHRTAAYTQAIMDLGATLCTRSKPNCEICPLASGCQALKNDLVQLLPEARPRKKLPKKSLYFLILQNNAGQILLEKRPPTGIWGGLWSLPEFTDYPSLQEWIAKHNWVTGSCEILPSRRHLFTHYQLDYTPVCVTLKNHMDNVMEANSWLWYKHPEIFKVGLPTPIKQLLQHLILEAEDE
jgi:A/G-specific adenine glycosylase